MRQLSLLVLLLLIPIAQAQDLPDQDGDSFPDLIEAYAKSNPAIPQSTPLSDDDLDGTQNVAEPDIYCTGGYGAVWPECSTATAAMCEILYTVSAGYVAQPCSYLKFWRAYCNHPLVRACTGSGNDWGWNYGLPFGGSGDIRPMACHRATDHDQDNIPDFLVCKQDVTKGTNKYTFSWDTVLGEVGDPDPYDSNNPVQGAGLLPPGFTDPDGDTYVSQEEVAEGSHPLQTASTPQTDDDGDGQINAAEPNAACTGAWGIVINPGTCGGWPTGSNAAIHSSSDGVFVWDGICTAPHTAAQYGVGLDDCKTSSSHAAPGSSSPAYSSGDTANGYAWRRISSAIVVSQDIQIPKGNDGNPTDQDGDSLSRYTFCTRRIVATSAGNYDLEAEGNCRAPSYYGDLNDGDRNDPLPLDTIADAQAALDNATTAAEEQERQFFNDTSKLVFDTATAALAAVATAQEIIEGATSDPPAVLQGIALTLLGELLRQAGVAQEQVNASVEYAQLVVQQFVPCAQQAIADYSGQIDAAAQTYAAEPTPAHLNLIVSTLAGGGGAVGARLQECHGPGAGEPVLTGLSALLVGATDGGSQVALATLAALDNATGAVLQTLNLTAGTLPRYLNDTLNALQDAANVTVAFLQGTRDLALAFVQDVRLFDVLQTAQETVQRTGQPDPVPSSQSHSMTPAGSTEQRADLSQATPGTFVFFAAAALTAFVVAQAITRRSK